jgi:Domain of unknown function (DUF4438), N-terminal/Domain of unknown function (DUF4438), C-terminal
MSYVSHAPLSAGAPRTNPGQLVAVVVAGQIANPLARGTPYRIGRDGVLRVVPGTGGIALNRRVGDRAVGLAGDHIEPGVALRNSDRESLGGREAPNRALMLNACIGNLARVVTGPATGAVGTVTGKHGGVNHVLVDFQPAVLRRLRIGDRIQIQAIGQGLRLPDFEGVSVLNLAPRLLRRWGIRVHGRHLHVPCTHLVPAGLLGSGLGRSESVLGDTDVQLSDADARHRWRLAHLRFGDLVAIAPLDARFGPSRSDGALTIGVVVHSDSHVAGHGPGVTPLLVARDGSLRPVHDARANLAAILGLRDRLARQPPPALEERRAWRGLFRCLAPRATETPAAAVWPVPKL